MTNEKLWQRSQQRFYFQNEDMDFYFKWVLANQNEHGAAHGECYYVASRIKDGDPESWVKGWLGMAGDVEIQATVADQKGHRVTAREAYLRASTYYNTAAVFIRPRDSRFRPTQQSAQTCFRRAMILLDTPVETVAISFEGQMLPGYFFCPTSNAQKRQTLIMIGGGETCAEQLYFWAGAPGIRRGWNVLCVDLPGQGDTPSSGLYFRYDYEAPMKAVVDYLLRRPDVDPDRLGVYGVSGGGYMVIRAVVFEKRIKACVANAPITDFYRLATAEIPPALLRAPAIVGDAMLKLSGLRSPLPVIAAEKFCWQAGVSHLSDALEITGRKANITALIGQITCPVLCLSGTGDSQEQIRQMNEFYAEVNVPRKDRRVFTLEEGAEAHCQVNNYALMQAVVFDWLDEVLH
jgi:pimeloyl-ACP methyl ester carboxylesterase